MSFSFNITLKTLIAFIFLIAAIPAIASTGQLQRSEVAGLPANSESVVRHSIGIARDTDDESIRYVEHHQYLADGTHLIRYFNPQQHLLLEKTIAYPGLPQHPEILQRDPVTNLVTTVNTGSDGLAEITVGSSDASFSFELSDDIIIDAGFDQYIRSQWVSFDTGTRKSVRFAVPGQNRLLKMRIAKTGADATGHYFTVEPENWLVRLILPEIKLTYSNERQLKRYRGFSNLKPQGDQSRDVDITFRHYLADKTIDQYPLAWMAQAGE